MIYRKPAKIFNDQGKTVICKKIIAFQKCMKVKFRREVNLSVMPKYFR